LLLRLPLWRNCADDALASAFGDDAEGQTIPEAMQWKPTTPKKQARAPRLKPLPPDLLIVAGTSLKVPGTKRIVREFAKACHARDRRVYYSSDESGDDSSSEAPAKVTRSGKKASAAKKEEEEEEEQAEEEEEEEEDINAPIRTILLNYDFPVPPSQWEGVFDVWVQGDVQQSALGLWEASKYSLEDCVNDFSMREDEHHQLTIPNLSWLDLQSTLEQERKALKKGLVRRKSTPPASSAPKSGSQKKAVMPKSPSKAKTAKTATSSTGEVVTKANASPNKKKATPTAKKTSTAVKVASSKTSAKVEAGLEKYMPSRKSSVSKASTAKKSPQ
jgi:hypothetical protein